MSSFMKELLVLGGPNGAGKSTAAKAGLLPQKLGIVELVNADDIAQGLSPFNPESAAFTAGRLMLQRMRLLADGETSFAIETTCSGKGHLKLLRRCREAGWRITLVFLWLPSPEIAIGRVAKRVAEGGHDVERDTIVRRYWGGLRNMRCYYLPLANVAAIYDNGGDEPILIAERASGSELDVRDSKRWQAIIEASQ